MSAELHPYVVLLSKQDILRLETQAGEFEQSETTPSTQAMKLLGWTTEMVVGGSILSAALNVYEQHGGFPDE